MDGLTLDPDDGRETGLRLKRHTPTPLALETPPSPYAAEFNETIRRTYLAVRERLGEYALLADAFGYALDDVTYGFDSDLDGESCKVRMTATYRLTRQGE